MHVHRIWDGKDRNRLGQERYHPVLSGRERAKLRDMGLLAPCTPPSRIGSHDIANADARRAEDIDMHGYALASADQHGASRIVASAQHANWTYRPGTR
ncbi:hypothetical protein EVG20_g3708 [Dentipellis fragilis]|uniref:Uncharacterized protein n=1 Tax=Dentipellis fragilis TaxID=205917 RepID=A0A4Y9Z297_9AGAM|nr:hypothetical protein EVG20_g3708 [Dentipellis fragilis]